MALKPADMWNKIKLDLRGKAREEQIDILRDYITQWPQYNGEYAQMKRKLKVRLHELERQRKTVAKGRTRKHDPFEIKKFNTLLVPIIGVANSGKSQLYNSLTNCNALVAEYPFSTIHPCWSTVNIHKLSLQIVDLPPVEYLQSLHVDSFDKLKGCLRGSDLFFVTIDVTTDILRQEDAIFSWLSMVFLDRTCPPCFVVRTKEDIRPVGIGTNGATLTKRLLQFTKVVVCHSQTAKARLEDAVKMTGYIKIFTKAPKDKIDEKEPLFVKRGTTVRDAAALIHTQLAKSIRRSRIWAEGASSPARLVKPDYVLKEKDVIEVNVQ